MTAGKTPKSAAKRSKLTVKISEEDKWKPTTDFRKQKRRPAAPQLRSTASAPTALDLFQQDYLKEFREKNPNDKSSNDAVFRKASQWWEFSPQRYYRSC